MSAEDMDCTVCVPFISLREESPDYNREKHATSRRFKLLAEDTQEDVLNKLTSDEKKKYMPSAEFEMWQCLANCRDLPVRDLKSALGGQAKNYLRPTQKISVPGLTSLKEVSLC